MTGEPGLEQAPPPRAEEREAPSFTWLSRWDWIAFVAALALMFTMSIDWYTTKQGEEFRRVEEVYREGSAPTTEGSDRETAERAGAAAEKQEKNAWQASAFVDRLILIALLAAFAAAVAAAFLRAAGRRFEPPWTPSTIAAAVGLAAALLIVYRMIQEPGLDEASVIRAGLPLSLFAVGVLAFAARQAALAERLSQADPPARAPRGEPRP